MPEKGEQIYRGAVNMAYEPLDTNEKVVVERFERRYGGNESFELRDLRLDSMITVSSPNSDDRV